MLEYSRDRMEIVVSFLAVLELMKVGRIRLSQASIDDDMYIEALEPEEEEAPENFREEGSGSES
ncbi:ScpA/B protein [[Clostridium] cf. saccharolyticum K10]|nr:ScpA/B protein [[Clostridium] cf. saccharolyticum K10]